VMLSSGELYCVMLSSRELNCVMLSSVMSSFEKLKLGRLNSVVSIEMA
jgi:hypothetical protein